MFLVSKRNWVVATYSAVIAFMLMMLLVSGCTGENSSVNPVNMYQSEGRINLSLKTIGEASVTYGHAPEFFVDNEIPLKYLYSVGLYATKITLITDKGEETIVYQADEIMPEPTFYLREDGQNNSSVFLSDIAVPAGNYVKMEMAVDRVIVSYKTSSTSAIATWDAQSYNKTIVLKAFSAVTVSPNTTSNVTARFDISGRVGQTMGQFYPFAYIIKE